MKPAFLTPFIMHTVLLGMSTFVLPALAEPETGLVPDTNKTEVASPVKAWLELQSSGKAASSQAQPLSGPVMDRVQERYLRNFSHPIPPFFEHVQPIDN